MATNPPHAVADLVLAQQTVALMAGSIITVRRYHADCRPDLAATVAHVTADPDLLAAWGAAEPEAVRDSLATIAQAAVEAGVVDIPGEVADGDAGALLDLAHKAIASGVTHLVRMSRFASPPNSPPLTYASSFAFGNRRNPAATLRTFAVLATVVQAAGGW